MPRPFTKIQILSESQKGYAALVQYLAGLTPADMTQPGTLGDWSVKDVLFHLYEWQRMVLEWIESSRRGETPHVPARGFKWNQIPALNRQIFETYCERSLNEAHALLADSHRQVEAMLEGLSEEQIFTPARYSWMNQNALAAYFVSCTSSHYRWALNEIRTGIKTREILKTV